MRDRLFRFFVVGILTFGLLVGGANQGKHAAAVEQGGEFSAAAVMIGSTGTTGRYTLPEAPGYPPANCIGSGNTLQMNAPGYITVTANVLVHDQQQVVVTESIYQRLANGSYAQVAKGTSTIVYADQLVPVVVPPKSAFSNLPIGPDYVFAYHIDWRNESHTATQGTVDIAYSLYHRVYGATVLPDASVCGGLKAPFAGVNTSTGTVNSILNFTLGYYPTRQLVPITWDGKQIGSVTTGSTSFTDGSFRIPAAPMGPHTIVWKYGHWDAKATFTVKPRIKLIPNTVSRGQTVDVSLRGYAAHESVRIRWKKGSSWVEVARVTTSSTGSANVNVNVPTWAPEGTTSVRGDGTVARAQTNAVKVSGGPFSGTTVKTPTPTQTPTPTATPAKVATSTPTPAATIAPQTPEGTSTMPVETPTPDATETAAPTETATPVPSPTETVEPTETPSPVEDPPTVEATQTP